MSEPSLFDEPPTVAYCWVCRVEREIPKQCGKECVE